MCAVAAFVKSVAVDQSRSDAPRGRVTTPTRRRSGRPVRSSGLDNTGHARSQSAGHARRAPGHREVLAANVGGHRLAPHRCPRSSVVVGRRTNAHARMASRLFPCGLRLQRGWHGGHAPGCRLGGPGARASGPARNAQATARTETTQAGATVSGRLERQPQAPSSPSRAEPEPPPPDDPIRLSPDPPRFGGRWAGWACRNGRMPLRA